MNQVTITVTGDKELAKSFRSFAGGMTDFQRPLGASGMFLTKFFSGEVFASRGGVIGKPWPDLNPAYEVEKAQMYPGRPYMVRTGELIKGFFWKAGKTQLDLGNKVKYFDNHQDGTTVPQRVMMLVDEQRVERVVKYIAADVEEKMSKEGLA